MCNDKQVKRKGRAKKEQEDEKQMEQIYRGEKIEHNSVTTEA